MRFGDPENVSLFSWSHDGVFLARVVNSRLIIENVRTDGSITPSSCSILKATTLPDRIGRLEWSSDSSYLACGKLDLGYIQLFSMDDPCWQCKIDVGPEDVGVGLEDLVWAPGARHILTTAAHYVEITVWSICNNEVFHISDILPVEKNKSFSGSGRKMAVAQFNDKFATCVGIYSTGSWEKLLSFPVVCKDLEEIAWCPDDSSILVKDSSLYSGLFIYSPSGELLKHFAPDGLAPGLPIASWSPTGQFLVTVNHRNVVRILNGLSYGVILEEMLEPSVIKFYPKCQKISEILLDGLDSASALTSYEQESDHLVLPMNQSVTSIKPKIKLKYSWDGRYVAIHTNSYPTTVWVWDLANVTIAAILVHINSVADFDWQPLKSRLLVCAGTDALYSWSPTNATITRISPTAGMRVFRCTGIKWNPTFSLIALTSKEDKLIKCTIES